MRRRLQSFAFLPAASWCLLAGFVPISAQAQSSSSSSNGSSSTQVYAREKAPSLIDPAGPTISLITSEPVFVMAAALNACGYDEGLEESAPMRKQVRDEMNQALAKSEDARTKRDALCLYIAQHRMTGTEHDIAQYISLALYLTPPPELETTADLTEMPPDSTQVVEIVPLLRGLCGRGRSARHLAYGAPHLRRGGRPAARSAVADDRRHQSLSQDAGLHLRRAAGSSSSSSRMLSPSMVNARIYGTDYVVVVSPVNGKIPHERRAPHLPALRHRSAALCALQRHRPRAADSEGDSRRAARVPLPLRYRAADHRVPDQGHRGAHHGYGRFPSTRFRRRRPLAVAALRARARRSTSKRWTRCAWPRCSTT